MSYNFSDESRACLSGTAERLVISHPSAQHASSSFLLLHTEHPSEPVLPTPRRIPLSLSFTPVSVATPNRCRLLGFTPLAEHSSPSFQQPAGSFRGPPEVRAKECAPCALFFTRADVFVSAEMHHQGLLAPSQTHYSPIQLQLAQPQSDPLYPEHPCSEPDEGQASATSSAPPRFWDGPPTSAGSTRASSPASVSDIYCHIPAGLTAMPMQRMPNQKKSIRRSRSLMRKDDPEDWWADDEWEDGRPDSYAVENTRRMSEPSGGKPKFAKELNYE